MSKEYFAAIENWRRERAAKLSAPHGWLATAGLFWLEPGENRMGAGTSNPIRLQPGSGPEFAGIFHLTGDQVICEAAAGVEIHYREALVSSTPITIDDETSEPLFLKDLKIFVIRRGVRLGVRIFDPQNSALASFTGLNWYEIDPEYRVSGKFFPTEEPRQIQIVTLLGDLVDMPFPGSVEFVLNGQELRLDPVLNDDGSFWFMFRDLTNGMETYPAGRYLVAEPPENGQVWLDFNRAYNPPCAFTEFATCPLPPPTNRLAVPIRAGERLFSD